MKIAAALAVCLVIMGGAPNTVAVSAQHTKPDASVTTTTMTFVDSSRSTPAVGSSPAQPRRVFEARIRYPTSKIEPLPLIVLVHGLNGDPDQVDELADAWAHAGYVVAVPKLPRLNIDKSGNTTPAETAELPQDVSFVIGQLLSLSAPTAVGPFRGRIDPRHIGAAGISLGGMTVYGLISNTCCLDTRVSAAILMSAVRPDFPRGKYQVQKVPVLLMHGDADKGYHWSVETYPKLGPPKWFITLRHGQHGPPFEDDPDEHDALVQATTTAFWDLQLKHDGRAAQRIVSDVRHSGGQATLQRDTASAKS